MPCGGTWHLGAGGRGGVLLSGSAVPGSPAEITAIGRKALRQGKNLQAARSGLAMDQQG